MSDEKTRPVDVECYAGYRGEERPRRIDINGRRIEIIEIKDRWITPSHRHFSIIGDDASTYLIRYDTVRKEWELVLMEEVDE